MRAHATIRRKISASQRGATPREGSSSTRIFGLRIKNLRAMASILLWPAGE